ncbi:hypothetical protein CEY11_07725 [Candidimonas nitroreducens]|uniref:Probable membrane transporter protein n=1 Tax=Candidimonas nitroreducens TaxID=683354 RepID=A0A225MQB6_9BURK|nr:hypothetical protein CEY11_07725 [Candidimonas nitroreducens]
MAFVAFAGLAVYTQNLTGFALALVLLSLVGSTNVVPLPDAINAVSIINIVNASYFLYRRRPFKLERTFRPAIAASFVGYFVGMGILTLLAAHAVGVLKSLLGVCIIGCALLLWRAAKPLQTPSSARAFALVGGVSGILGGVFSSPGPPLVYAVYRQPWPMKTIQETLVFSFGIGAAFRLAVMGLAGQVSMQAVLLGLESLPVAFLITTFAANRKLPCSREVLRHIVCVLLACAGLGMLI